MGVIRPAALGYILGQFLLALGGTLLIPLAFSLWSHGGPAPLAYAAVVTAGTGGALFFGLPRPATDLNRREGLLLVFCVWLAVSFFGALPFYFSPAYFSSFTDAFFEATSGFTASGATILRDIESLPRDLQFWRCFSHWLGGMGIVLLGIAILPLLGMGGMALYRAEFSGARSEKLKPRIAHTAQALWKIYVFLTLAEYVALRWAGMNSFDALCHSFSTVATGGFSTRTASVGAFDSPLIECIIVVFMLLGSINFTLHYRLWVERRPRRFISDFELRTLLFIVVSASLVIAAILALKSGYAPAMALRKALFQVTAITTTTGFTTDNFAQWLPLPQLILLALMFMGGCTGSTSGGLKTSRMVLLYKVVIREFERMVERRGVFAVRVGSGVIPETAVRSLLNLVYLSFLVNFLGCILLAASGVDVFTSIAAVAAAMFNIGPGLGNVGPVEGYGGLPAFAKWVLSFCMLAGRLEFYTVLVIFTPAFWHK